MAWLGGNPLPTAWFDGCFYGRNCDGLFEKVTIRWFQGKKSKLRARFRGKYVAAIEALWFQGLVFKAPLAPFHHGCTNPSLRHVGEIEVTARNAGNGTERDGRGMEHLPKKMTQKPHGDRHCAGRKPLWTDGARNETAPWRVNGRLDWISWECFSLPFWEIWITLGILWFPGQTHTHTHTDIYLYIYYICIDIYTCIHMYISINTTYVQTDSDHLVGLYIQVDM